MSNRIGHLAIVQPKRLFVDVAEQVKRFNASRVQKRPEVFHRVSVGISVHVFYRVIDDLALKISL
jgi:hypothetical protein